ncbi:hypothetical protein HS088_TW15G00616 [Tripterygium wilfordii]|uniref:tRNA (guanosine(18)-2'-O)-methyltransferase TARBP1 n=1 Tax=Tripterygium wilfordii TaxID=458696 RepID=A0A7J7CMG8_TRIWF|nr:hypothetical protein HS088_TW15G00616 [Tripterygium wilfordii]
MKMVHAVDREILNLSIESFLDVVNKTGAWEVLKATMVPFLLRSIGISMGMVQNEELNESGSSSTFQGSNNWINKEYMLSLSESFPLPVSCHILASLLDAVVQSLQRSSKITELMSANQCSYLEKFSCSLLLDLCNMAEQFLSQSLEHRSCTISLLLPCILRAFNSTYAYGISVDGQTCVLSRNFFIMNIWKRCRSLFSLGPFERRDAYTTLSLCLSSYSEGCKSDDMNDRVEEFDIRAENEFWDEIKRGLVDEESLVRKQSLYILKKVLCISGERQSKVGLSERKMKEKRSNPGGMTKREIWADKEAKSLGVGNFCDSVDSYLNNQQQWEAFILLFEMLEEYGTHLVEAAWNHQVTLLLQSSNSLNNFARCKSGGVHQNQMETLTEVIGWLVILWERGFRHDNPQVRCLIMQSFLGVEWITYGMCGKLVPESFVLGPFVKALDDPVHHTGFGVKGVYTSRTIEGATHFLRKYASCLNTRERITFLFKLASVAKDHSFGRAGFMALADCIASASCGISTFDDSETEGREDVFPDEFQDKPTHGYSDDKTDLLGALRFLIQSSKQHFNPNYRLRVCMKILEAAASVVCSFVVPLEILLNFISTLPREFTDYGGSLRLKLQEWLLGCGQKHCSVGCRSNEFHLLKSFQDFPVGFSSCHILVDTCKDFDNEDLNAWESEAKRWARALFVVIKEDHQLDPILSFIECRGINMCEQCNHSGLVPVKFLIITISLVSEIQILQERAAERGIRNRMKSDMGLIKIVDHLAYEDASTISEKFAKLYCLILGTTLPNSVTGKLGGPSQRRLSSSNASAVLQAITSMKAVAYVSSWCGQFSNNGTIDSAFTFLWNFFKKTISSPTCASETGAEIRLAAYEALAHVLRALVSAFSTQTLNLIRDNNRMLQPAVKVKPWLDLLVLSFLRNVNDLLAVGVLARTRRAVLLNWKWLCLESLLSIPCFALEEGLQMDGASFFLSEMALKCIFSDLVESLENAAESSVLPMLRSVRLAVGMFASGSSSSIVLSCSGVDVQMMWHLVRSSWILHVSCNKRRVASIAALLSSVLHPSVFGDECMHLDNASPGPLKWFIEKVIEEGTKSPRTIRLSALHLTGLWLSHPRTIKYYIKELKLLTLYGSVAFDEDFEAELADNQDGRLEVSLLAKSPNPELTEEFINTELYARVSVAVLFYKLANLADVVKSANENEDSYAALESGKLFLLELLDSVVNDKDLAKELYKKYSAVHRRKIRAWQMICVLSRFVRHDIIEQVTHSLHISLNRNNLPAVRQYLETFAISIYLKFPSLVREQLVPILRDYDMRPQALSSYVFVAANVILHASKDDQSRHVDELLPPIVPLLTSHHHSLRGFTQLLVHQVLSKVCPPIDCGSSLVTALEKRCFVDLKLYLANNYDCTRLRASMEGYLDAYDPKVSVTPAGIFVNRVEDVEFECVPTSLMERVLNFLNDVREDLRSSMAKDAVTIKNESLKIAEESKCVENLFNFHMYKDTAMDFQKKVTISKPERLDANSRSILANEETYELLADMEKEDELLEQSLHCSGLAIEKMRRSRQQFILVASLLDRIPNLAGLARTCEVFKASHLAIADMNVLRDKQFQLISVTAEKWVPIIEVPVDSVKHFLEKKKREGFSIFGLEQTANSVPLDQFIFPKKTVLVLGREKEGIPVDIIHVLDACVEIPQLGVVRSLNVHVSGAIALWEYTRQQRS